MKIAIYGDSYARAPDYDTGWHPGAWYSKLKDSNPALEIDNFGVLGSSLWYSYRNYLDTHQHYDKHIFFVTSPERFTFNENSDIKHISGWHSISQAVSRGIIPDNEESKRLETIVRGMYEFLDRRYSEDASIAMCHHLLSMNTGNTLFLPCFNFQTTEILGHPNTLFDISNIDMKHYNLDAWAMALGDLRPCHLNPENNQILADKVRDWIFDDTPLILKVEDFVASKSPKEHLFKEFTAPLEM